MHISRRIEAFDRLVDELGFEFGVHEPTDFSAAAGSDVTGRLCAADRVPEAIVYENEALAMAGLGVIVRRGIPVPGQIGVVTFENTALCEAISPSLTALDRDPFEFGADVAERMFEVVERGGADPLPDTCERIPQLIARDSTGRSRHGSARRG